MALPPGIPTSFVPHVSQQDQMTHDNWLGIIGYIAYGFLGFMVIVALGAFAYSRILSAHKDSADAALATAEATIDAPTVEGFVQLHNRLDAAKTLLASHVAPSNFFAVVSAILPKTVRFKSLQVSIDQKGSIQLTGSGIAASFNALSAASVAFGNDGRIKDVIFSKMDVQKDNSVAFSISGTLDSAMLAYTPGAPETESPTASATSTTL